MTKKTIIRNCAINGLRLDGSDVARTSRDGRRVTLRHSWVDDDGRAIYAVMTAVRALAADLASAKGHDVAIIDRDGSTLDVIYAA